MPLVEVQGVGTIEFPDNMSREDIAAAIKKNFPDEVKAAKVEARQRKFEEEQAIATKESEEKGFFASLEEGFDQAQEDFAIGSALMSLDSTDAQELLEQEYQQWKASPAAADDPGFFSKRGLGKLLGEVAPNVVSTVATGAGASFLTSPIGGVVAGGATSASISGVTAKGATFRNDYFTIRQKQDAEGNVDPQAAFETARDTSNKAAAISAAVSGASATIPVGRLLKPGSTVSKKLATEVGFDAGLGAVESISSDVYAEAQGVERGDVFENALRSAAGEAIIGGPFAAIHSLQRGPSPLRAEVPTPRLPELETTFEGPRALLEGPPTPRALLEGPDLTAPSRALPGPTEVTPMVLNQGKPIIDTQTGDVVDWDDSVAAESPPLLDKNGDVINFEKQNDAPRQAALEMEIKFDEAISNKRVDPESGKLGFRRTAEDFISKKTKQAPPPEAEKVLKETGQKPEEAPTTTPITPPTTESIITPPPIVDVEGKAVRSEDAPVVEKAAEEAGTETPTVTKGRLLHEEFRQAVKDLGGRVGSGVDPVATYRVFKSLVKMAAHAAKSGVKNAAQFAKRIGVNLTKAVQQAWNDAKAGVARTPKDVPQDVVDDITGADRTAKTEVQEDTIYTRAKSKVDRAKRQLDLEDEASAANTIIRKFVDRFVDLKILQRKAAKGQEIPDTMNSYLLREMLTDKVGARLSDFNQETDALFQRMRRNGISKDDFELFLHARHAPEANARIAEINAAIPDGGSGLTNAEAVEILQSFQDRGMLPTLNELGATIKDINQRTLDIQFEGGLIDQGNYQRLSTYYQNYVPLRRETDLEDHIQAGNFGSVRGQEVKKRKGSGKPVVDILANTFSQHASAIERAETNRAHAALGEFAKEFPNDVVKPAPQMFTQEFNAEGQVVMVKDRRMKDRPDILTYKIAGEEVPLQITNPDLAKNLKNAGLSSNNVLIKWVAAGNRWLALVNTQLNPNFVIPNFVRDLQTAAINLSDEAGERLRNKAIHHKSLRTAFRTTWNIEMGKKDSSEWATAYREYRDLGGKIEFFGLKDVEAYRKRIERGTKQQRSVTRAIQFLADKAGAINAAMENTVRLSVFKTAKDAGISPLQAASLAKNITVNFSRRGEWSGGLNSWFLFFNAGVQGSYRIAQALKSPKVRKVVGGVVAAGAFSDLFNQLISEEDTDGVTFYDKIPDHIKERNMIIMLPAGGYLKIPMPYGYNAFHYAGQNMMRTMRGNQSAASGAANVVNSTLNAFNPISGGSDLFEETGVLRAAMPDVGDILVDVATNKDWKQTPIFPVQSPFDKYEKPDSQKYFTSVSEPSKYITQKLNELTGGTEVQKGFVDISPETLDATISHIFGGLGQTALEPFTSTWTPESTPIIKRFVGAQQPYYDLQNYYDLREEAYISEAQVKKYRESKEIKKLRSYLKEARPLQKILPLVKSTDKKLADLRRRRQSVQRSRKLNAVEKAKALKDLQERQVDLVKAVRKRFILLQE